ncbi:MAG: phenylalanine--tRNA ligase subunit alpha, partial [Candidatus Margulisiibacteriota bacterium]
MQQKINLIESEALKQIEASQDISALNAAKNSFLGRKGEVSELLKELPSLKPEEKKEAGSKLNQLKMKLENAVKQKEEQLGNKSAAAKSLFDFTLPGKRIPRGRQNILTKTMNEMIEVFSGLGYTIAEGPEIESEYYNFEALNIPSGHPSRDMWSTLYIKDDLLLRTHTSPVQIR